MHPLNTLSPFHRLPATQISRHAKPRTAGRRLIRAVVASFVLGLFVATSFAATWTNPVTTTPSFIQTSFGPYGSHLPGNGGMYCGPTAIAMELYWLGANGFSQIAPASYSSSNATDVAAATNLIKVLGGLANTSASGGTSAEQLATAVQIYFSAKGIDPTQVSYQNTDALKSAPTASWFQTQLASNKIQSPTTITFTNLLVGWFSENGTGTNNYVRTGGHFVDVVDATSGSANYLTVFNPSPSSFVATTPNIAGSNPQTVQVTNLPSNWTVEYITPPPAVDQYQQIQTSSLGDTFKSKGILETGQSWAILSSALPTGSNIKDWQIGSSQTINTNGGDLSVIAALKGSGGLSKAGLGTLTLTGNNSLSGDNVLGGGTLQSTVTSGTPFGTGNMTCSGTSVLELKPANSSPADISLAVASGSNSTLTVDNGGLVLRLTKGNNTSLTVTLGGNTDTAAPNITRNNQGNLEITTDGGLAALGSSIKLMVAGSLGNLPVVTNGMVSPYTVGQDSDAGQVGAFLNYDSGNGFQAASTTKSSLSNIGNSTATTIYQVDDSSVIVAPSQQIAMYALQVGAYTVGGDPSTSTLIIGNQTASGMAGVILNGGTISPQLQFGAAQANIYTSLGNGTISSYVSGSGGLVKFGPGALTLSMDNSGSLSGPVYVNSGTLIADNNRNLFSATGSGNVYVQSSAKLQINNGSSVSGNITAVSSATVSLAGGVTTGKLSIAAASGVQPGACLEGYGIINGNATVGGDIKAGSTPGTLSFRGTADLRSANFYWQLNSLVDNSNSSAGTGWNALEFTSSATLGTNTDTTRLTIYLDLSKVSGPDGSDSFWNTDHQWTLFSMTAAWNGYCSPGNFQYTNGFFDYAWTKNPAGQPSYGNLSYTANVVPEPSIYVLFAFGLVGLCLVRVRLAARA